jgi:class 3 adenylate cyclase/CheY-like chemotaxis protein
MARILIVDDKNYNLNAYKLSLEDAELNASILFASNENEAIAVLESADGIDLIVTDLMMLSETGGMEVLQAAKQRDPLLMVIMVTAYEKKLDRYRAFELGAFDCLEKGTPGIKTDKELAVKARNALRFRETTRELLRSSKTLDFLKRYFDPTVFSSIQHSPEMLEPTNRTVTIVFWDIRGFSLLSEILKAYPKLIAGFLKQYFEVASRVIFKHGGVLDKFIGDGVMALFGPINTTMDEGRIDALNAVRAAMELREEFQAVYADWLKQWELYSPQAIDIGLGCGVHTGEVLVGNLGTELRDHFTAVGPHVNFAARIESKSSKGQIRISSSTKARIEGKVALRHIETVTDIKNIPGKFEIFEIGNEQEKS